MKTGVWFDADKYTKKDWQMVAHILAQLEEWEYEHRTREANMTTKLDGIGIGERGAIRKVRELFEEFFQDSDQWCDDESWDGFDPVIEGMLDPDNLNAKDYNRALYGSLLNPTEFRKAMGI